MIAKIFNMEESHSYDNLKDETIHTLPIEFFDLTLDQTHYQLSFDKKTFDNSKQVKIRLLCPFEISKNLAEPL